MNSKQFSLWSLPEDIKPVQIFQGTKKNYLLTHQWVTEKNELGEQTATRIDRFVRDLQTKVKYEIPESSILLNNDHLLVFHYGENFVLTAYDLRSWKTTDLTQLDIHPFQLVGEYLIGYKDKNQNLELEAIHLKTQKRVAIYPLASSTAEHEKFLDNLKYEIGHGFDTPGLFRFNNHDILDFDKTTTSFVKYKAYAFQDALFFITPEGYFGGYGDYQKYIYFKDEFGQIKEFKDLPQDLHQPDKVDAFLKRFQPD